MKHTKNCLILILLTLLSVSLQLSAAESIQTRNVHAETVDFGTWLWDTRQILQNDDVMIDFMNTHHVSHLYLQIDYELSIDAYKHFIKKASANGINVQALDGAPQWVLKSGSVKQKQFFDWLSAYQQSVADNEKFQGVHLDIEPYLLAEYSANKNKVIENYQSSLIEAKQRSYELELPLFIDIPFWFDEEDYNTSYGKGMLAEWIIQYADHVVIMAYRDHASGAAGIIRAISNEVKFAKQHSKSIIAAVETQKLAEENEISFYEEGQQYMVKELNKVYAKYKKNSGFGGFAVHHIISWMQLSK